MSPIFIGITGASASGKSLLSVTIYDELKEEVGAHHIGIIKEDSYYKDQTHLSMEERLKTNYDHPSAFDHGLLVRHMDQLKEKRAIDVPVYDYKEHNRAKDSISMEPRRVIIIEGILLLSDKNIRSRLDTSIFVDTPLDICLLRRLQRDIEERGRTMESVIKQYKSTVRPMFLEFVEPTKQYADIIVPKGGKNRVAIEMLKARIKQLLA
ncbi:MULTISPECIES: uridine kinase [Hahella]|uniref:Uridine kinase n=1 Tax=Hahella chejuensis (strain KCTC 2396) TaxID=349521 RepID=Q2SQQ5_HAHCH|nr:MULTISPECIES: uridine kinase [Hahella]ABC27019.1 uridine kinase [Hahella chejuensis KCTC 2396]AZZ89731.1 uridine kinase [Hahella sp. KA22]MBU6950264.1 uridine kinase [Hahella sp. HN01]MDG9666402.1 uridine kinase [Hahella sp. CR1]QAY53101.1 uridine kinase [Hahella sp. KA22]